jgi:hypothetical protein
VSPAPARVQSESASSASRARRERRDHYQLGCRIRLVPWTVSFTPGWIHAGLLLGKSVRIADLLQSDAYATQGLGDLGDQSAFTANASGSLGAAGTMIIGEVTDEQLQGCPNGTQDFWTIGLQNEFWLSFSNFNIHPMGPLWRATRQYSGYVSVALTLPIGTLTETPFEISGTVTCGRGYYQFTGHSLGGFDPRA